MNLYFLVEGKETEPKVYRSWLSYLLPQIQEVQGFQEVSENNYLLIGARHKSPSFVNRLRASIQEININKNYDYLIICIDAEDRTVEETINEIEETLSNLVDEDVKLTARTRIEFIIQNRCIETWFLGNRRIFSRTPQNPDLLSYINHFNVFQDDPEEMERPADNEQFGSHAQFHYEYLRLLFCEKNIVYTKQKPREVQEKYYLDQLLKRVAKSNHLRSLKNFFELCEKINNS
jgi:hypothetical protein